MPKLPRMSGEEAIKTFKSSCVIPLHKELAIGTLRGAIKQAGITVDEFITAYKKR